MKNTTIDKTLRDRDEKELADLAAITVKEILRHPEVHQCLLRMGPEDETAVELISAYAESAVKRYTNFVARCRCQSEFAQLVRRLVLAILKETSDPVMSWPGE